MFHFEEDLLENLPKRGAQVMTDKQFVQREITRFKSSVRRQMMLDGVNYFAGRHDILHRRRTVIGENGEPVVVTNLPNNRVIDNQYRKMVKQKTNYLAGRPITFQSENETYLQLVQEILNRKFMRTMKQITQDALNEGIAWLFPTYDEHGQFVLKRFRGHEIIPGWADADHTLLEYAIRVYQLVSYENDTERIVEKCEVFDENGVWYFGLNDDYSLVPEEPYHSSYLHTSDGVEFNWIKIPLIPFRRDAEELPLIRNVKSLQDGINSILSNFENNMEEDVRNTILVLVNYDGENLGEFRRNLSTYGAVKVKTVDGAGGDLRTLTVEVNSENYKAILGIFKKAIIENAMGFDAKDDRMGGQPNQMNIQSMYSDIDLDANDMETEFQASFEELLWFINCHLANTGKGNFDGERIEVIFNRDMMLNEGEVIQNIRNSEGILSDETLIAQHPWVTDVHGELDRMEKQKREEAAEYQQAFTNQQQNQPGGDEA